MTKAKKKTDCVQRKVGKVMHETKGTGRSYEQRVAMSLSIARKHCGVKSGGRKR